jgi:hypothetical protein
LGSSGRRYRGFGHERSDLFGNSEYLLLSKVRIHRQGQDFPSRALADRESFPSPWQEGRLFVAGNWVVDAGCDARSSQCLMQRVAYGRPDDFQMVTADCVLRDGDWHDG